MISHFINSYQIPFIPSQNYIVYLQIMNLTKRRMYVKGYTEYYICIKVNRCIIKTGLRNVNKVQIPN